VNRTTLKFSLGGITLLSMIAMAGGMPAATQAQHVQGQSFDDGSVWVVDDQTAQAQATCAATGGTPCPVGQVVVGLVNRIPLATAAAAHRHYSLAPGRSAELDTFVEKEMLTFHDHAVASLQRPTALSVGPRLRSAFASPIPQGLPLRRGAYCSTDHEVHNQLGYTVLGTSFTWDGYYHVTNSCTEYGDYYNLSYDSGRQLTKNNIGRIYNGSGNDLDYDGDEVATCQPIPYGASYSFENNVWGQSGLHSNFHFSSGNSCTIFDTYASVDLYWY